MVCVKAMPWHAEVGLVKCIVFLYKNPIHYTIWQFKEYFMRDKAARHTRQYKDHVHAALEELPPAFATQKTFDIGHYAEPTNSS